MGQGEPLLVADVREDPRWSPKVADSLGFETQSISAAPMEAGDEVLGVLEVIDRNDGELLTEEDLHTLTAFSGFAAGLMLKAQIYADMQK